MSGTMEYGKGLEIWLEFLSTAVDYIPFAFLIEEVAIIFPEYEKTERSG